MYVVSAWAFEDWRDKARRLLMAGLEPEQIAWRDGRVATQGILFAEDARLVLPTIQVKVGGVPAVFLQWAEKVACHRDEQRWDLLYRCLWRLTHGEKYLLGDAADPLVRRLQLYMQAVGRDIHKMHAFVRFRKVEVDGVDTYLAFHRPDHYVVRAASPFFVKRFRVQQWGILTPEESVCWDGKKVVFGEGMPAEAAPQADDMEVLWLTYYRNIFNPARIKTKMMKKEMPVRHWKTLPETAIIKEMLAEAPARVERMMEAALAEPSRGALRRREMYKK